MGHTHRKKTEDGPSSFLHCVGYVGDAGPKRPGQSKCDPMSHGGLRYVITCSCGAVKTENRNQNYWESSGWIEPEKGES